MKRTERSLFNLLARALVGCGVVVSLVFLIGFVWLYQMKLHEQRADAAQRVNLLLQVSLENAMLKRDIPGLEEIVDRLGRQTGVASVAILNPQGQVRFASRPELRGRSIDLKEGGLFPAFAWDARAPIERSELLPQGFDGSGSVLRSVKTVANRAECRACHGDAELHPVNGLLVIEQNAQDMRRQAVVSALLLAGSGLVVALALIAGLYTSLRRHVLAPLRALTQASEALARGAPEAQAPVRGASEIATLGRSFNEMADKLRRNMEALRARERFVQGLIEMLPDGVRVIDKNYRIVLANDAYHRIHGLPLGAAVGQLCHCSSHRRNEPCVSTLCACPMASLREGDAPMRFHAIHRRSDGADVSVEVNAAWIPSVEGGLIVEVIRDLDAMMQVSHEQRLSELGQLATGVAHEIRNPLSCASILLREDDAHLASLSPQELADAMVLIRNEIDRCLAITDSLLKLGAPPAAEPELVELNGVVAEMVQFLRYQAESAHVTLATSLEGRLRVLASDSDIRVVVINLVQNALHAMPGGGALRILGMRAGNGKILLKISDTGIGVPPEHLKSIFLPFWSHRADGVRGTGLGLSICRSLVRAAGGEIHVSSVLGEGATFSVELPDADFEAGARHGD